MVKLSPLKISGRWFVDAEGRRVILRGVDLGGRTNIQNKADGATHLKEDWRPADLCNV